MSAQSRVAAIPELRDEIFQYIATDDLITSVRQASRAFKATVEHSNHPIIKWNSYRWDKQEVSPDIRHFVQRDASGNVVREVYPGLLEALFRVIHEVKDTEYLEWPSEIREKSRTAEAYARKFLADEDKKIQLTRPPMLARKVNIVFDLHRYERQGSTGPIQSWKWACKLRVTSAKANAGLTVYELCKQVMIFAVQTKRPWWPEGKQWTGTVCFFLNLSIGFHLDDNPIEQYFNIRMRDPLKERWRAGR
ncbi:hypothetical protein TWF281_001524 [Arthrobotrys megalospora]